MKAWGGNRRILIVAMSLVTVVLPAAGQGIPVPSLQSSDAPTASASAPQATNDLSEASDKRVDDGIARAWQHARVLPSHGRQAKTKPRDGVELHAELQSEGKERQ